MDKKRKRESKIPTLVYSAPGHNRFAKLFTETSLDEIKEIVRKRLGLSASDFTLFYDTDISLENNDDFDAFEVHAHAAASAVNVLVKLSSSHAPPAAVSVPSVVPQSSVSMTLDTDTGIEPPRKKKKVAGDAQEKPLPSAPKSRPKTSVGGKVVGDAPPKPTSSAPGPSKRKGDVSESISAHAVLEGATKEPGASADGEETRKKKRRTVGKDTEKTPPPTSATSPGDISVNTGIEASLNKKSKKVVDKDPAEKPKKKASVVAPSTANEIPGEELVVGDRRKAKSQKTGAEPASKPSTSKKSTKNSKNDQLNDVPNVDTDGNSTKSVKFTFPEQLADAISAPAAQSEAVTASGAKTQSSSEKVKKPKGKKKVVEQDVESPDPEAVNEFLKSITKKLPIAPMTTAPETQLATDDRAEPPAMKRNKAPANGSVGPKQTGATGSNTPCPVCKTSPFHLRYRCPVVLAGSDRIRQRIAELQHDDKADHSKLIQELGGLAEKDEKTTKHKDSLNVNTHSQHLRADARERGVSDQPVNLPGRKVAAASGTRPDAYDSDSSGDDSAPSRKKAPPRPANSYVDAELEAIIRGPLPSRLTVDDLLFDEEEEEESAESVVLENDDDDIGFRRRSRRLELVASSGEEDEEDEENFSTGEGAKPKIHTPAVINISVRSNSRHSAPRSPTAPLMTIDARQSVDFDSVGDIAVGEVMASDSIMFDLDTSDNPGRGATNAENVVEAPNHSGRSTPIPVTPTRTPNLGGKTSSGVAHPTPVELHELLNDPSRAALQAEDDPIQAADDFPPTPVQPNKVTQPGTPSTPRMVQRMKDRNGKIPVKLSQLDPPFSLSPQVQTQPPEGAQSDAAVEPAVVRKTTRSLSRLASAPPVPSEQPAKRRRAPNKTPEQRAEEEAAKLAAREERERIRKEKAQAKTVGKNPGKREQETENCPATGPAQRTPPPNTVVSGLAELSVPPPSRTPMSQDEWTVLKPSSPTSPHYRDGESMRDELRSSSPSNSGAQEEAPLFLPAESQIPFPYSQWNSVPAFHAGSPKDSEDEDDEDEVAASIKSSVGGRPTSYRRLTDIASQPSLFSTPTLRAADFPPATFPSVKDKRAMLYGSLPQEDDDSSDSNSSAGEAPSHIPKSRRAGMTTRQR